jgi:hypothetical protein
VGEYEVRRLCADHSLEAAEKQIRLMRESTDDRVIFMVTEAIMSRGIGKPRDHSNEDSRRRIDLSALSADERETMLALLRKALGPGIPVPKNSDLHPSNYP